MAEAIHAGNGMMAAWAGVVHGAHRPQCGSHHVARIAMSAAGNLFGYEAIEMVSHNEAGVLA
jgi:hypothetical protein